MPWPADHPEENLGAKPSWPSSLKVPARVHIPHPHRAGHQNEKPSGARPLERDTSRSAEEQVRGSSSGLAGEVSDETLGFLLILAAAAQTEARGRRRGKH